VVFLTGSTGHISAASPAERSKTALRSHRCLGRPLGERGTHCLHPALSRAAVLGAWAVPAVLELALIAALVM
jgi:hypothetical protein